MDASANATNDDENDKMAAPRFKGPRWDTMKEGEEWGQFWESQNSPQLVGSPKRGPATTDSQRESLNTGTHQRESVPTEKNLVQNETNDNRREGFWSPPSRRNRTSRYKNIPRTMHPEIEIRNRFYILESLEKDKTMEDAGVFEMKKDITAKCQGFPETCTFLRDGTLLIKSKNLTQSGYIEKLRNVAGMNVKTTPHPRLNTCKGTVLARRWERYSEDELCEHLQDEGVIHVKRLKSRPDKKYTGERYLLTFHRMTPPEKINGGLERLEVREFIPSPRRCFNCQGFGHMGALCRRAEATCATCSGRQHTERDEKCKRRPHCRNCGGSHPVTDRACPVYKKEQEILTIATREKVSFHEARKAVRKRCPAQGISYSDALKQKTQERHDAIEMPRPLAPTPKVPERSEVKKAPTPKATTRRSPRKDGGRDEGNRTKKNSSRTENVLVQPGTSKSGNDQNMKMVQGGKRTMTPEKSDEEPTGGTPPRKYGKTGPGTTGPTPKNRGRSKRKEIRERQEKEPAKTNQVLERRSTSQPPKPKVAYSECAATVEPKEREMRPKITGSLLDLPMPPGYQKPMAEGKDEENQGNEKSKPGDDLQEQAISVITTQRQENQEALNRDPRTNRAPPE